MNDLITLEELARNAAANRRRHGLVYITKNDWIDAYRPESSGERRKSKGTRTSQERAFERYKKGVRSFLRPGDPDLAYELGMRDPRGLYGVNLEEVSAAVVAAIEEAERLRQAYRDLRPIYKLKGSDRQDTIADVAKATGANKGTVLSWVQRGAPHTRDDSAKKNEIRIWLDIEEIEDWLRAKNAEARSAGKKGIGKVRMKERVPVKEARPVLRATREYLDLSVRQMAKLLDVSHGTMKSWLGVGGREIKTIPASAVDKAEEVSRTYEGAVFLERREDPIFADQLREALEEGGGIVGAARILKVRKDTIRPLAQRLGVEIPEKKALADRFTKRELKELMSRHPSIASASREIGVSDTALRNLLKQAKLRNNPGGWQRPRFLPDWL